MKANKQMLAAQKQRPQRAAQLGTSHTTARKPVGPHGTEAGALTETHCFLSNGHIWRCCCFTEMGRLICRAI